MDEVDKFFTDRRISLSARGLLALVIAMPNEWKYRWHDLISFVPDAPEAIKARNELQGFGIDISRVCPRAPANTTHSLISSGDTMKEKEKSSAGGRGGARAREEYPETTEEVILAASDRAYAMSIQEAANFLAFYGASGWSMKDGRPIANWKLLIDKWKVGQTPAQYQQAQQEWRRRKSGLPPQEQEKYVTLETGEKWPESQSIYLHDYDVWVKASGVC